jgi:1-acyl-sn-glycerol-3-phosphate acyltransferase
VSSGPPSPAASAVEATLGERAHWAVVFGYTAVSIPFLFAVQAPVMLATGSGDFSIWLARRMWAPAGLRLAGVRVEIQTLAPLPEGPAIYASNHESVLDPWALFVAIPRSVRFLAKAELFRIPVFGHYLRLARFVPVDRGNRARAIAALRSAAEIVRAGTSLVVFPEGTRSTDGCVQTFKKGPFVLAKEARVPVVPVAISGASAVVPKGRLGVRPGTIRVAIGPAVDPAEFPAKDDLLREVRRRIAAQHHAIGGGGAAEDATRA